ncbi:MAG: nickel pincer cofactor biosynthesis protein LarC [Anaerolineales bacterium]|nr:nickel pincer cofactor biosynthesis protein LarC [Anaerolineales bacterium]
MKIAYFDCFSGASGDMILGALLDAGFPEAELREGLAGLGLAGLELRCQRILKGGLSAVRLEVLVSGDVPERRLAEVEALIDASRLPAGLGERAMGIFHRLAQVEARIHGLPIDQVHLHELGGVDTIVDVVGALLGLRTLNVERVVVSPLPLGRGEAHSTHGAIPLPAPATLALLSGVPVVASQVERELVTPTAAAILTSVASDFGPIPAMTLSGVGYGAGAYDLPLPDVLRLILGEAASANDGTVETLALLETNIDDSNPEIYDYVMERLFAAGALDVFITPVQMKKNRPAVVLGVLCRLADCETLTAILFSETSTLGVRQQWVERRSLKREITTVQTAYGPVRVKIATWGDGNWKAAPEAEDCRRLAEAHHVPLRQVYRAAENALAVLEPK